MICHATPEAVVLVHGLAAPRWVMSRLGRSLTRDGYRVKNWGYPSIRSSVATHARSLRDMLQRMGDEEFTRTHLVTHSMGGMVARCLLADQPPDRIGRVVMLAPPNHGSPVARRLAPYLRFFCRTLGELSDEPGSFVRRLAEPDGFEIGIIAAAADAVVPLPNTRLACQRDHIVLPGRHGLLPLRRDTGRQVLAFLRTGQFERNVESIRPTAGAENESPHPATPEEHDALLA